METKKGEFELCHFIHTCSLMNDMIFFELSAAH